jgi:SOS-response transcriptional repressor LexA
MAGDPACWYFWEQIGLTKSDVARAIPDLEERLYSRAPLKIDVVAAPGATRQGTMQLKKRPDAVGVPLLRDAAAAGSPRMIEQAEVEDTLVIPRRWCPHPENTTCIRVSGRSMYPVLDDGYIVAVDTFLVEFSHLVERMVAARDPEGGITIKWLRKVGDDYMLIPQHTSPEYPPALISREPGWKIVGEVIWWIGKPQ